MSNSYPFENLLLLPSDDLLLLLPLLLPESNLVSLDLESAVSADLPLPLVAVVLSVRLVRTLYSDPSLRRE